MTSQEYSKEQESSRIASSMGKRISYNAVFAPILEYVGIITGISGLMDDGDISKMSTGLALYMFGRGVSSFNRSKLNLEQATLEKLALKKLLQEEKK